MKASVPINPSQRAQGILPFLAMDILDLARNLEAQGKDIIHLELGEPDFPPPPEVVEAVLQAIQDRYTGYTSTQGIRELREAISELYYEQYNVIVDPDRIIVTMGSSPGMLLLFGALLNPGEEIILPNPYYPPYYNNIRFLGGIPKTFSLIEDEGFRYDLNLIKEAISSRTKGIILNSPSNPTGMVQEVAILQGLAEIAEEKGLLIISDEIYHGLTYGITPHSILEFSNNAFVLSGFSKRYAMTGWRLGWLIAPENFISVLKNLHMNYFLSASAFVQKAGVVALKRCSKAVEEMRLTYQQRRDYLIPELRKLGFGLKMEPQGAFYLLVNAQNFDSNSLSLSQRILRETGVAVTPGIDFGERAEGYLRISYATALPKLKQAIERLEKWSGTYNKI